MIDLKYYFGIAKCGCPIACVKVKNERKSTTDLAIKKWTEKGYRIEPGENLNNWGCFCEKQND